METLIAALKMQDPKFISIKLLEVNAGDATILTTTVNVHYPYIPEIEESFSVPITLDLPEEEVIKQQIINTSIEI